MEELQIEGELKFEKDTDGSKVGTQKIQEGERKANITRKGGRPTESRLDMLTKAFEYLRKQ